MKEGRQLNRNEKRQSSENSKWLVKYVEMFYRLIGFSS